MPRTPAWWDGSWEHPWFDFEDRDEMLSRRLLLGILDRNDDGYKATVGDLGARHEQVIHALAEIAAYLWVKDYGPVDSQKDLARAIADLETSITRLLDEAGAQ